MFTGIVEAKGKILCLAKGKEKSAVGLFLPARLCKGLKKGDSLAVNGVCLTIRSLRGGKAACDLLDETLRRTNLRYVRAGMQVNLERSLRYGSSRMGGHFLSGHVDATGTILRIEQRKADRIFTVRYPSRFAKYLLEKGSIGLDGVSLTVVRAGKSAFSVHLIPHTLRATALGRRAVADKVNLEFDVMAKYLYKWKRK